MWFQWFCQEWCNLFVHSLVVPRDFRILGCNVSILIYESCFDCIDNMTLLVYISCNGLLCVKYARLYVFSEPYFRYTERSRFCPDTAKYKSKKTPVLAYIRSGTINKTRQYQTFSLTSCTWQFDLSTKYYHRLINLPWRFCFELQIRKADLNKMSFLYIFDVSVAL